MAGMISLAILRTSECSSKVPFIEAGSFGLTWCADLRSDRVISDSPRSRIVFPEIEMSVLVSLKRRGDTHKGRNQY